MYVSADRLACRSPPAAGDHRLARMLHGGRGEFDCSPARNGLLVFGEKIGEAAGAVTVPAQAAYIDLK